MAYKNIHRTKKQKEIHEHDKLRSKRMEKHLDLVYKMLGYEIRREYDAEKQRAGIDLYLKNNSWAKEKEMIIDEKASTDYTNGIDTLNTQCIELTAENNEDKYGWHTDPKSKTEAYAFAFARTQDDFVTVDAIEVYFVSKQAIQEYMESVGIKTIQDAQLKIMQDGSPGRKTERYCNINDECRLVLVSARKKPENPLLFCISRERLEELSYYHVRFDELEWGSIVANEEFQKLNADISHAA